MHAKPPRTWRQELGSVALVVGVVNLIMLIAIGVPGVVAAYLTQQGLRAAAREGAAIATQPGMTMDEISLWTSYELGPISSGQPVCPAAEPGEYCLEVMPSSPQPCLGRSGDPVVVTVRRPVSFPVPVVDAKLTLTGRVEARCL